MQIPFPYPRSPFIRPMKDLLIDQQIIRPMKDLLIDQQKGRFLTPYEKKEIKEYAEKQRKKNLCKK